MKVENTDAARPQTGIDQADVVYEEVVEGDITRFVAIFNSTVPGVIGPVRSVRAEDPDIVWPLGGIFAYSGGAPVNVDAINAAPVHAVDEDTAGAAMVRNEPNQPPRDAPHNLYGLGQPLFDLGGDPKPPPALFQYLANGAPAVGRRTASSTSTSGFEAGYDPTWTWDGRHRHLEARRSAACPRPSSAARQIAPANVVVQFTQLHRRGRGPDRGRGRRLGLHRRRRCAPARGCGPTRRSRPSTSTPPATRSRCGPAARGSSCSRSGRAVDVTPAPAAGDHACRRPPPRRPPRPRRRSSGAGRARVGPVT